MWSSGYYCNDMPVFEVFPERAVASFGGAEDYFCPLDEGGGMLGWIGDKVCM